MRLPINYFDLTEPGERLKLLDRGIAPDELPALMARFEAALEAVDAAACESGSAAGHEDGYNSGYSEGYAAGAANNGGKGHA